MATPGPTTCLQTLIPQDVAGFIGELEAGSLTLEDRPGLLPEAEHHEGEADRQDDREDPALYRNVLGLDPELVQSLDIVPAAIEHDQRIGDATRDRDEADREKIVKAGTSEIIKLKPEERAAWKKAMTPVWEKFAPEIGKDVIDDAQSANKAS